VLELDDDIRVMTDDRRRQTTARINSLPPHTVCKRASNNDTTKRLLRVPNLSLIYRLFQVFQTIVPVTCRPARPQRLTLIDRFSVEQQRHDGGTADERGASDGAVDGSS